MDISVRVVGQERIDPNSLLVVKDQVVRSADYSGRELLQFSSAGSRFEGCRFEDMDVTSASFGSGRKVSE